MTHICVSKTVAVLMLFHTKIPCTKDTDRTPLLPMVAMGSTALVIREIRGTTRALSGFWYNLSLCSICDDT